MEKLGGAELTVRRTGPGWIVVLPELVHDLDRGRVYDSDLLPPSAN